MQSFADARSIKPLDGGFIDVPSEFVSGLAAVFPKADLIDVVRDEFELFTG